MLPPVAEAPSGAPDAAAGLAVGREPGPAWLGSGRQDGPATARPRGQGSLTQPAVARSRELGTPGGV